MGVRSSLGQTNPYKNPSYEVKWVVKFVGTCNLAFPYNHVHEIKLLKHFVEIAIKHFVEIDDIKNQILVTNTKLT